MYATIFYKSTIIRRIFTIINLRPLQQESNRKVYDSWSTGHRNVALVAPTGTGKTVQFSDIVRQEPGAVCLVVHRQELVGQISMALAENEIVHKIIGPRNVIEMIIKLHLDKFGKMFYNSQSHIGVAGVDTLIRRGTELKNWLPTVKLWVIDEAHHVQKGNKWGTAVNMFPNARGLGVTATPLRTDGGGLGAHNDGVFHDIVLAPNMRDHINQGWLTDYRIFAPVSNVDMSKARKSSATGDWNKHDVSEAVAKSNLVVHSKATQTGDVVRHYLRIAKGKLGITFVPDMDTGRNLEAQFNAVGVRAKLVNAKTPDRERAEISKKFKNHEYEQLINVDIFGEGYDLPALEVVSFARPTASFGLYCQMFGRVLRLMINMEIHPDWNNYSAAQRLAVIATSDKPYGIIIDHVGIVAQFALTHGLPDSPQDWNLEAGAKRGEQEEGLMAVKSCPECTFVYEKYKKLCPNCGHVPIPASRSSVEYVDGDLSELSLEILAQMRGEIAVTDSPIDDQLLDYRRQLQTNHCKPEYVNSHCKRMSGKLQHQQNSQMILRDKMAWWAGHRRAEGFTDAELFKVFYLKYGVDWLTAQALPGDEADKLTQRIRLK